MCLSEISLNKEQYIKGVLNFLDFSFERSSKDGKNLCRRTKCVNYAWCSQVDAYEHIINHEFLKWYINWISLDEQLGSSNFVRTPQAEEKFNQDMDTLIHDTFAMHTNNEWWYIYKCFFSLPYWEDNVLCHNLDVMHIEKNVCDDIIGTLLHLEGKSKDNDKAHYNLVDMNTRG